MALRRRTELRHPLSLPVVHILLALADGARHGYAIKQAVEERSGGEVRLGPGTADAEDQHSRRRADLQAVSPDPGEAAESLALDSEAMLKAVERRVEPRPHGCRIRTIGRDRAEHLPRLVEAGCLVRT